MKKLFALLMSVVFVLGFASITLAATESFSGDVEVKYSIDNTDFDGDIDPDTGLANGFSYGMNASVSVDYTKNFSDTVSAGIKLKISPNMDPEGDGAANPDVDVNFDGDGWITIDKIFDMAKLTLKTGGVDAVAGNIDGKFATGGTTGAIVDVTMEPVAGSFTMNNNGFGLKAEVALEGIGKFGGAYASQFESIGEDYGYGVWGELTPMEGLTVKAEYDGNYVDADNTASAYLVEGTFAGIEGLSITAGYEGHNEYWDFGFSLDGDFWVAADQVFDIHNGYKLLDSPVAGSNVYGVVSYAAIPDFLTLKGEVAYTMLDVTPATSMLLAKANAAFTFSEELNANAGFALGMGMVEGVDENEMAYQLKGDVSYKASDVLTLSTAAVAYLDNDDTTDTYGKISPKAEYKFAEGVLGTASFDYIFGLTDDAQYTFTLGVKATF